MQSMTGEGACNTNRPHPSASGSHRLPPVREKDAPYHR